MGANRVPISGFVLKWPGAKPLAPLTRRGAGAVERGGLENRCPPCGGPRVRIPPSPPVLPHYRPYYNYFRHRVQSIPIFTPIYMGWLSANVRERLKRCVRPHWVCVI